MNRRALLKSLALGALAAVLPIRPTRAKAHTFRGVQWDYVPRLDLPGEFVCNWHGREIRIDGATVWMSRVNNPLDFDTAAGDEDAAISLTPTIGLPVPILDIKSRRDSLVIGNRYGTYRLSHDERRRVFVLQQESIR